MDGYNMFSVFGVSEKNIARVFNFALGEGGRGLPVKSSQQLSCPYFSKTNCSLFALYFLDGVTNLQKWWIWPGFFFQ